MSPAEFRAAGAAPLIAGLAEGSAGDPDRLEPAAKLTGQILVEDRAGIFRIQFLVVRIHEQEIIA
jgi:hypothetical protein